MSPVIIIMVAVGVLAFCVELYMKGSVNYVYNCASFGAVIVFVGTLLLAAAGKSDFSFGVSYAASSVTYYIVFYLLQGVSEVFLYRQGRDVSAIWDSGTRIWGRVGGALLWPLMAPIAIFGGHCRLKKLVSRHDAR